MTCFVFPRDSWKRVQPDGFPDLRVPRYVKKPSDPGAAFPANFAKKQGNLLNVRADFDNFNEIPKILEKRALFLEISALPLLQTTAYFAKVPGRPKNENMTPPF